MTKKAFVHDRIAYLGGAGQVLIDLIRVYQPSSFQSDQQLGHPLRTSTPITNSDGCQIFTLFSTRKSLTIDGHDIPIQTALPSWINQLFIRGSRPAFTWLGKIRNKLFDYRNLIVIYPWLVSRLQHKIEKFHPDLIVISSFAAVKNVIPPVDSTNNTDATIKNTTTTSESFVGTGSISSIQEFSTQTKTTHPKTILYLHSPMQYIHENYEEYLRKLSGRQLKIFKPTAKRLRKRDLLPRKYDFIFTNSHYTAECAKRYYGLASIIRYPRIDHTFLETAPSNHPHSYYLYVGRLVRFIREADLIIHLFNHLQLPLLVMGSGPDELYLKSIAGPTITFIGSVDTIHEKITLIRHARGLINLTKESCGMATMEALAVGVPVFGYNAGGSIELVPRHSGQLVDSKEISNLIPSFEQFHTNQYDREKIKQAFLEKYNS